MKLTLDDNQLRVLNVDSRLSTKQALLRLGGRFNQKEREWTFPRSTLVFDLLKLRFPQMDVSDLSLFPLYHEGVPGAKEYGFEIRYPDQTHRPHEKWGQLYEFQKEAVDYLLNNPHRGCLLGLSPGLGKSAVSLIASQILGSKKILIISILSLLETWKRQVERWRTDNPKVEICWGVPPSKDPQIVVTNYDTVCGTQPVAFQDGRTIRKSVVKHSFETEWDLIIIDESILVKNRKAARSKAIELLGRRGGKIWELSGSPISKYADDLYQQLRIIEPKTFSSYWRFVDLTCEVEDSTWGPIVSGTRDDVDVKYLLRDFYFVRNQKDVLDLPPLLPETIYTPLTNDQELMYRSIEEEFQAELENGDTLTVTSRMAQLTRLLQVASNSLNVGGPDSSSKCFTLQEMVHSEIVQTPCLIWVHWIPGAVALLKALHNQKLKVGFVVGGMEDVDSRIQQYLNGDVDFLVLSMTVGKYGHTFTNTRSVVYYDKVFDMDAYIQSMYRVQRIGLDHPVPVYSLVAKGTVDEIEVMDNLSSKAIDIARITNADLLTLMRSIRGV